MTVDLVVRNGKIVTPYDIVEAGMGVDNGRIVLIAKDTNLPEADASIDAKGGFVLPGLIDAHVHFRDPGNTEREDFETGTKAAAAGGVTTILEMPISTPAVSSAEIFERRKSIVERKAVIDFGLYGGAGQDSIDEIRKMARVGAVGFKTFLQKPQKGRENEFRGIYATDNGSMLRVLQETGKTGLISSVHAEDNSIIEHMTQSLKRAGRTDPMAHIESRPDFAETISISSLIILANAADARLHIAHMSTKEGVRLVGQAKASKQRVTAEAAVNHLMLTSEAMKKMGSYAKINPPLRSREDVEELWKGLNTGTIDIITSDHAPYVQKEKDQGSDNIWNAFAGSPQIETMLPLLLTKVNEGKMTLNKLVKVTSESVAKIFGLYPKKGTISVGSDADFVIVNMSGQKKIDRERMYTKARTIALYDGWSVKGLPVLTVVRGRIVMNSGEFTGKPGYGAFIRPLKSLS